MAKLHEIKYKKLDGEIVARGYNISIKRDIVKELNLKGKELKIEVKDGNIVISEVKDEKSR